MLKNIFRLVTFQKSDYKNADIFSKLRLPCVFTSAKMQSAVKCSKLYIEKQCYTWKYCSLSPSSISMCFMYVANEYYRVVTMKAYIIIILARMWRLFLTSDRIDIK